MRPLATAVALALAGCGAGTPVRELRVAVSGPGSVLVRVDDREARRCNHSCSVTVAEGKQVAFDATPRPAAEFEGFAGACEGEEKCVLTVRGDVAVQSSFVWGHLAAPRAYEWRPIDVSRGAFLPLTLDGNGNVGGTVLTEYDGNRAARYDYATRRTEDVEGEYRSVVAMTDDGTLLLAPAVGRTWVKRVLGSDELLRVPGAVWTNGIAMSEDGVVVGEFGVQDDPSLVKGRYVSDDAGVREVGPPDTSTERHFLAAVNTTGTIVGNRAVLESFGGMWSRWVSRPVVYVERDALELPIGDSHSVLHALSETNVVVGSTAVDGVMSKAFLYAISGTMPTVVEPPDAGGGVLFHAIDPAGRIAVGWCWTSQGDERAVVYEEGHLSYLQDMVSDLPSSVTITRAVAVNAFGQIVAVGRSRDQSAEIPMVLTPTF